MAIGVADKHTFYIVRSADDTGGPSSQAVFRSYRGYFTSFLVKADLSGLHSFEAVAIQARDASTLATQKTDFASSNLLYVMSGTKLISKMVIDRSEWKNDGTVVLKGFQSSGTEIEKKKLLSETTDKDSWNEETLNTIFNTDSNAVTKDKQGNDIISIDILDGSSDRFSMKFNRLNRVEAVKKGAVIAEKEWYITHGTNDASPYSEGDELVIASRIGSSSSTYTFYITGNNKNSTFATGDDDDDSMVNEIYVSGTVQNGKQGISHIYYSTGTVTHLNGALDSWLYEPMSGGIDVMELNNVAVELKKGQVIWGAVSFAKAVIIQKEDGGDYYSVGPTSDTMPSSPQGYISDFIPGEFIFVDDQVVTNMTFVDWTDGVGAVMFRIRKGSNLDTYAIPFIVKIGDEMIWCDGNIDTSDPDYDEVNVYGMVATSGSSFGRGVYTTATEANPHNQGDDVVNWGSLSPFGFLQIPVDSISGFSTSGVRSLKIGSETVNYNNQVGNAFWVSAPLQRNFADSYAHGDNMRVQQYADGLGNFFRPGTPDTSTANSINDNGAHSRNQSSNDGGTLDALDRKAVAIIENRDEVLRIKIKVTDYFGAWAAIDIGDTVTLSDTGLINIAPGDYRVMGFEYEWKGGFVNLIYYLNENSIRTFAITDFNFVGSQEEANESKFQEPTLDVDEERLSSITSIGETGGWQAGANELKNVADPTEAFDAVNKKYVDQNRGRFEVRLFNTAISPNLDRNIIFSNVASPGPLQVIEGLTYFNTTDNHFYGWNGSGWVQLDGSGGGSTYWSRNTAALPFLLPLNVDDDVCPNGVNSYLGQSGGNEWPRIYTDDLRTESLTASWNIVNVGAGTHRIRNLGGTTTLEVTGDIIPTTNLTYNLGRSGFYWNTARVGIYYCDDRLQFNVTDNPYITAAPTYGVRIFDAGSAIANFRNIDIQFNRSLDISGGLDVSGAAYFDGTVQLGNASGDFIEIYGWVDTDIIPNGNYALGDSVNRWGDVYAHFADFDQDVTMGSSSTDRLYIASQVAGHLIPSTDGAYNLGTSLLLWNGIWAYTGFFEDGITTENNAINTFQSGGWFYCDQSATFFDAVYFEDDVYLGSSSADNLYFNSRVIGDIEPDVDGTYDLGSSTYMWDGIWAYTGFFEDGITTENGAINNFQSGGWFYCDQDATFDGDIYNTGMATGSGTDVVISGADQLLRKSSSIKYKKEVTQLKIDSSKVFELTPVSFKWKSTDMVDFGLIAEEVYNIIPELVNLNRDEAPESVKYDQLAVLLLQELKKIKENQEKIMKKMEVA